MRKGFKTPAPLPSSEDAFIQQSLTDYSATDHPVKHGFDTHTELCCQWVSKGDVTSQRHTPDVFFSVQGLHGFRQVVTHVQPQQKDEL